MQVACTVKDSIHGGKGLFSTHPVAKGTLLWDFLTARIRVLNEEEAKQLSNKAWEEGNLATLCTYAYWQSSEIGNCSLVDIRDDDGRYFNHSWTPNVGFGSRLKHANGRQIARSMDA